jgi:hypothetical protein
MLMSSDIKFNQNPLMETTTVTHVQLAYQTDTVKLTSVWTILLCYKTYLKMQYNFILLIVLKHDNMRM